MASTFPISKSAASRITDRWARISPENGAILSAPITTPFSEEEARLWGVSRSCPLAGMDDPILSSGKNTAFAVLAVLPSESALFLAFFPGEVDNTQHMDQDRLQEFLSCQHQIVDVDEEWEDYGEPLFDPLEIEVDLMVMDYFRRADADLAKNE